MRPEPRGGRRAPAAWRGGPCVCGVAAAVLLAGCAARPLPPWEPPRINAPAVAAPVPAAAPPAAAPPAVAPLLARLPSLSADELAAETNRLLRDGSPQARLQQALLLTAPNNPLRDELRARQQLEDLAQLDSTPAGVRDGAALALLWLDEQRRGSEERRRAQSRAREDELRITTLETRMRELERRALDAEKKLEALRAIERELSGRSSRAP
ncbi:MAG: hypothetical protein ING39_03145 [Burkholderiales bacterium]|nr:hypothetical protein [Burkholderiales bacterium]